MTLLISLAAAVIVTAVWYMSKNAREMKVGVLCYMFWGASLMWMVDAVAEYIQMGAEYFAPAAEDMMNDAFLGVAVVVFALVIWVVYLIIKDPKHVIRERLHKKA